MKTLRTWTNELWKSLFKGLCFFLFLKDKKDSRKVSDRTKITIKPNARSVAQAHIHIYRVGEAYRNKHIRYNPTEPISKTEALLPYRDEVIKPFLLHFKYYMNTYREKDKLLTEMFGRLLLDEILSIIQTRILYITSQLPHLIVHIPSSSAASGKKTYDQMEVLGQHICTNDTHSWLSQAKNIVRISGEAPMLHFSKNKKERREKIMHSFRIQSNDPNILIFQKSTQALFIVDDITTTGASLDTVRNYIENIAPKKNANMYTIALAH